MTFPAYTHFLSAEYLAVYWVSKLSLILSIHKQSHSSSAIPKSSHAITYSLVVEEANGLLNEGDAKLFSSAEDSRIIL